MLYAFLCYNNEDAVFSWSQEEDDAVMARLAKAHEPLEKAGRFGPSVRLMPTTAATTLRKDSDPPLVIDGPYAETKEQLLGFYVIDCADLEDALSVAREFAKANPGGAYEVRPLRLFAPGTLKAENLAEPATAK
ncbi:MAG TPA: YciI family protein [Caulobacteraceae bacterium]|nr:YciI family protein [Caulobacteraceae bacterium]